MIRASSPAPGVVVLQDDIKINVLAEAIDDLGAYLLEHGSEGLFPPYEIEHGLVEC